MAERTITITIQFHDDVDGPAQMDILKHFADVVFEEIDNDLVNGDHDYASKIRNLTVDP